MIKSLKINMESSAQPRKYFPEIDGLRALSVIGVILFHAELAFPGGYIGVDVFFVISGYLITSIIYRKCMAGTFSLKNFWGRRTKRIIPAAATTIIVTAIVSFFLFPAGEFSSFAKSAIASSLVVANVFFWRNTGYFQLEADTMPLLHMWSLAVEEQFYIFFPPILFLLVKFCKKRLITIIILGVLLSLVLSILTLGAYPEATFYLLPTRAWELGIGAIAALCINKITLNRPLSEVLSAAGLCGIILCMCLYQRSTPFPGAMALPPCIAGMLFIVSNYKHKTTCGRLLSFKPIVIVGLMSYSLYLWHWPVLVIGNHYILTEHSLGSSAIMLALILLLSFLSWQFIEKPFRSPNLLKTHKSTFLFWGGSVTVTVAAACFILFQGGMPYRLAESENGLIENTHWNGRSFSVPGNFKAKEKLIGAEDGPLNFFIWGDSHCQMLSEVVDLTAKKYSIQGRAFITPAIPPLQEAHQPNNHQGIDISELNEKRAKIILESGATHVILVARWNYYLQGYLPSEKKEAEIKGPRFVQIADSKTATTNVSGAQKALTKSLTLFLEQLKAKGMKLWIVKQVPHSNILHTAQNFLNYYRFPSLNRSFSKEGPLKEEYLQRSAALNKVLDSLKYSNLKIIDPVYQFYTDNSNLILGDELPYYRDDDHLSRHGAKKYMTPVFEDMMKQISQ